MHTITPLLTKAFSELLMWAFVTAVQQVGVCPLNVFLRDDAIACKFIDSQCVLQGCFRGVLVMVSPSVTARQYIPVEITTQTSAQGLVLYPRAGATLLVSPKAISGFGPKELVLQQHSPAKDTVAAVLKSPNVVHFMVIAATTWLMVTVGLYFDAHFAQGYYIKLWMLMPSLFLAHIVIFALCVVNWRGKEITSTSNVEPPFNIVGLLLQPVHTPVHTLLVISTRPGTGIAGFGRCISSPLSGPVAALVVRDVPDNARPVSPNSNATNYSTPAIFLHSLGPDDGHGTTPVVKNTSSAKHVVEKIVPSRMFVQNAALYSLLRMAIFSSNVKLLLCARLGMQYYFDHAAISGATVPNQSVAVDSFHNLTFTAMRLWTMGKAFYSQRVYTKCAAPSSVQIYSHLAEEQLKFYSMLLDMVKTIVKSPCFFSLLYTSMLQHMVVTAVWSYHQLLQFQCGLGKRLVQSKHYGFTMPNRSTCFIGHKSIFRLH